MVGIVVVAHSEELAKGVCALAKQMSQKEELPILPAGGMDDDGIGTSLLKIQEAIEAAYSNDGVLVLMDLGSAVMTTQMYLEMLPEEKRSRIRLSSAPLVEGAIAAAVSSSLGDDLDKVQDAAENALSFPKIPTEEKVLEEKVEEIGEGEVLSLDLLVPNPIGLHARPAAQFVQTASRFQAKITVQNISHPGRPEVDAKSMMQVASQGTARQGEIIRIKAQGVDAREALEELKELVLSGFGEMEGAPPILQEEKKKEEEEKPLLEEEIKLLKGIPASEGVALAPAFIFGARKGQIEEKPADDPELEVQRFRKALEEAKIQLSELQKSTTSRVGEKTGAIFEFHQEILNDPLIISTIEEIIRKEKIQASGAVSRVFSLWEKKFEALDDPLMKERAIDIQDVKDRLLSLLVEGFRETLETDTDVILIASDLTPSETASLPREKIKGIATARGGPTSHSAILARMLGIPAVLGLGNDVLRIPSGVLVALDGQKGTLEVNPSEEAVRGFLSLEEDLKRKREDQLREARLPALTTDQRRVEVVANIGNVESALEALKMGAEGVGLLRTEFLYLERETPPTEEEQFQAYFQIAEVMAHRPLIIRTLDIGGDKQFPYLKMEPEMNPFLGLRAIRLCFKEPDLFLTQLKAILRASPGHNLKIMLPMIATVDEVIQAKEFIQKAKEDLRKRGIPFEEHIEVGIMVEIPSSAILADVLAEEVDFFSIGSNDLTQYTLAADRGNELVNYLAQPLDPSILRLIHQVIEAAHSRRKWAGLCGELAGQREAIPILLGLGLDEFSMNPRAVPGAKSLIRSLSFEKSRDLAREALKAKNAKEVQNMVEDFLSGIEKN
ncbi:MAG: phosphoenolpyruvate--protein phosphotransferase [Caldiserica bacterium]|jgi:phosphocarrier protein FPr|nr:phosphoenolpyruvate--protein phosphotransferase [Caldisericota bacterium]MDH7561847.1 phosphoenolpyruvate--protein phosphotransferase [Caldisericota bacterium]